MNAAAIPQPATPHAVPGPAPQSLEIHQMTFHDMKTALIAGFKDWEAYQTYAITMAAIYPVAGVFIAAVAADQAFLPFVFPVLTGFALLGPLATLWFAALSRKRERGEESALSAFTPAKLKTIQNLSGIAILIFLLWNGLAAGIYFLTLGTSTAEAGANFFVRVFTTTAGWEMIILGCGSGAVFAILALGIGCVSFPLALDRPVSATLAITTSLRAMARNPVFAVSWGALIVAGLVLGALPALFGLVIVLPVLGHATWHVYRRMVG